MGLNTCYPGGMEIAAHPSRPNVWLSADGRVFRELAASPSDGGYATVKLGKTTLRRHVLVCEMHHGPRPPGMEVRHLDGDPTNDSPENLAWGTRHDNMLDVARHGRVNGPAKLTWPEALEIRRRAAAGERQKDLAVEFGVTAQTINDIHRGRAWVKPPPDPTPPKWWVGHPGEGKGHH